KQKRAHDVATVTGVQTCALPISEKYNGPGHVRWAGRIYGSGLPAVFSWGRSRVYHGIWGLAPYQSLYEPAPSLLSSLPRMPEWYLIVASLAGLSLLSIAWSPLRLA